MSLAELNSLCSKLPVRPPIWKKLSKHQRVGLLLIAKYHRIALFYDTGTGKSCMSIAASRYLRKAKIMRQALVLVPNKVNTHEWAREILKHSPNTSYRVLEGSTNDKWVTLEDGASLLTITTYPGLLHMVCTERQRKRSKKMQMVPDMKLIKKFCKHFDALFLDESIAIGNRSALPFRICRQIAKRCKVVVPLCGTPFGRDPTPLWAQMFLVDWGQGLGENLGIFRGALFKEKENYWSGFPEYHFDKTKKALLTRFLAHRSIRYKVSEADLPRVTSITKMVYLPEDTRTYYQKAKDNLKIAKSKQERENLFIRMRQLSSGWLGYKDELDAKAKVIFEYNPKLEMLTSILESIRGQNKAIVFHDFITSGEIICNELKRLKIGHVWVRGGVKDPAKLLDRFDNDDDVEVMVLNSAGAFGLNLQKAKYGIAYESPVSVLIRTQMERRFIRQHSEHDKVFLFDLLVADTVDVQIRAYHKQGKDLLRAVVDGENLG